MIHKFPIKILISITLRDDSEAFMKYKPATGRREAIRHLTRELKDWVLHNSNAGTEAPTNISIKVLP